LHFHAYNGFVDNLQVVFTYSTWISATGLQRNKLSKTADC